MTLDYGAPGRSILPGAKGSIRFHLDLGLFCFSFSKFMHSYQNSIFISLFHKFTFLISIKCANTWGSLLQT